VDLKPWKIWELWGFHFYPCFWEEFLFPLLSHPLFCLLLVVTLQLHSCWT
jgi:hypothetical protein